jgi:hypothetical protein
MHWLWQRRSLRGHLQVYNLTFFNSTNTPFLDSKSGREMVKKNPQARWIPSESMNSSASSSSSALSSSSSTSVSAGTSGEKTQPAKKQKGNVTFLSSLDSLKIDAAPSNDVDYDLIPFFVSPVSEQSPNNRNKVLELLDTGSLAGNFIASRI